MGKQSILNKWWFQTAINALMTAAISAVVYWVFDAVKPTSPQVELQMQKDSMLHSRQVRPLYLIKKVAISFQPVAVVVRQNRLRI